MRTCHESYSLRSVYEYKSFLLSLFLLIYSPFPFLYTIPVPGSHIPFLIYISAGHTVFFTGVHNPGTHQSRDTHTDLEINKTDKSDCVYVHRVPVHDVYVNRYTYIRSVTVDLVCTCVPEPYTLNLMTQVLPIAY